MFIMTDVSAIYEIQRYKNKKQGLYFSSVTHELRTPLNSIIPLSDTLKPYLSSRNKHHSEKIL